MSSLFHQHFTNSFFENNMLEKLTTGCGFNLFVVRHQVVNGFRGILS